MSINVNVYEDREGTGRVIARVKINRNLDSWDGSNWSCGGRHMHKGITRLKDGRYVIMVTSDFQGARDYGYVVDADEALQEVLKSGQLDILENSKFLELKQLMSKNLVEEDVTE